MATTISRTDGNILRSDTGCRDEIRAAAHVLAAALTRDSDECGAFVLEFHKDEETGDFEGLGVYEYETFADLQESDEEPYDDEGED